LWLCCLCRIVDAQSSVLYSIHQVVKTSTRRAQAARQLNRGHAPMPPFRAFHTFRHKQTVRPGGSEMHTSQLVRTCNKVTNYSVIIKLRTP